MNMSTIMFLMEIFNIKEFKNKRILEVGSRYVNGSVRPIIERFLSPGEYIGIDIESGKNVDKILPAEDILKAFNKESFDIVISTEVLEHVKDWRLVINNFKEVLKKGGSLYVTTRSKGFHVHGYPYDFWRYEIEDMKHIFSDFSIVSLKNDPLAPGVFLKVIKPLNYKPNQLDNINLYSIILKTRTNLIPNINDEPAYSKLKQIIFKLRKRINKIPFPIRFRYMPRK